MFETDTLKTSLGDLKITFIGHGTLMFALGDTIIHVDPVSAEADYSKMPKADLILITHEHFDHLDPAAVAAIRKPATTILLTAKCAAKLTGGTIMKNGDTREVIDEIVALSKKHGIITNYTSFLVTDPSENHRLANNRPMPAASPVANRENSRWFAQPRRIAVSDESPRMTDWRQVRLQSKAAGAPGAGGRAQFAAAMPLPSQGEESMGRAVGPA
ncbi:MAG TPA: MBL fold metallo-hydrolase, partial [Planctomycetota bacterium]|nr:MBL fold metallo-hydrolase [Planctomycetota bacterium]